MKPINVEKNEKRKISINLNHNTFHSTLWNHNTE